MARPFRLGNEHFFETARHGGWLDALHFYSGRDPKSERIWVQWTRTESAWRNCLPQTYPSFDEWHYEALKTCGTDDKDELTHSPMADDQFAALVIDYIEWEAFAFWARAIAESAAESRPT